MQVLGKYMIIGYLDPQANIGLYRDNATIGGLGFRVYGYRTW